MKKNNREKYGHVYFWQLIEVRAERNFLKIEVLLKDSFAKVKLFFDLKDSNIHYSQIHCLPNDTDFKMMFV